MLAPIATAYEQAMTEGEGKNTWRTDRYSPCPRQEAGRYLVFLVSIGYQLSHIEQAVVNGAPYEGDAPPGRPLPCPADSGTTDGTADRGSDERSPNPKFPQADRPTCLTR